MNIKDAVLNIVFAVLMFLMVVSTFVGVKANDDIVVEAMAYLLVFTMIGFPVVIVWGWIWSLATYIHDKLKDR